MLKFFRKIRQSILAKNNISKYLMYATGEIFLVVIGILIALSINNANDARKEKIELNNYLLKIYNDVNRDIEQIAVLKIRRDTVRMTAIKAFNLLIKKDFSKPQMIWDAGVVFREFYFIPNKSGFEAIKSSPYLGNINNTKLDSLLTQYYALVDNIENRELGYNTFIEEMEAELLKSVDPLPNATLLFIQWQPDLLDDDVSASQWKTQMYDELLPRFENNAFKSAIARVVNDGTYIGRYRDLYDTGQNLVDEISMTISSK